MIEEADKSTMQERAAERAGIPVALLSGLLGLSDEFSDLNLPGAKGAFAKRVAEILEAAAADSGAPT